MLGERPLLDSIRNKQQVADVQAATKTYAQLSPSDSSTAAPARSSSSLWRHADGRLADNHVVEPSLVVRFSGRYRTDGTNTPNNPT